MADGAGRPASSLAATRGAAAPPCQGRPGGAARADDSVQQRCICFEVQSVCSQSAMSYVGSGEKIGRLCSEASGPPDRKRPLINDTAPRHVRTRPPRRENLNNNNACPPLLAAIICSHTMTTAAHYYLFAAARMAARRSLTVQCRPRQCSPCLARKRQKVEPRRVAVVVVAAAAVRPRAWRGGDWPR